MLLFFHHPCCWAGAPSACSSLEHPPLVPHSPLSSLLLMCTKKSQKHGWNFQLFHPPDCRSCRFSLGVGKEVPAKPPLCSWVGIVDFRIASPPDALHNSQQVTSPCWVKVPPPGDTVWTYKCCCGFFLKPLCPSTSDQALGIWFPCHSSPWKSWRSRKL